ncbi:MAG: MATE family efflux transporter [Porticoccaceae bacterium]|nr:MATE family efflux transporter [Porticoccaceae bacterium]MBT6423402.1 MATE family efflux transporter [Porticoccaceae bacterium]MBT7168158.1 MATE family efflux transporter [Porticoccaceae bacterium]MBT7566474.1 MATE family efflux transporter [Porticoccaceae bacterium]
MSTLAPHSVISQPRFSDNARILLRLAAPLIMGQIAVVGMTVTDIYMGGQVDADTLAALQLGGSVWSMINLMVIGIMIANSPIIGNFWGAGQPEKIRFQFQQVLWLSLPLGIAVISAVLLGVRLVSQLDISANVYRITVGYLYPFLITGFIFPAFFAFRTTFEGIGDTRPVVVFNSAAFILNGVLDYALVFGKFGLPALGGIGAAWATVVVMIFLITCMALYARHSTTLKSLHLYQKFAAPNLKAMADTLRLGIPIALNIAAEFSFFAVIPFMIAHLGSEMLAAHAITINIDSLAFMVPLGIAQALTIKIAHAQGGGNPHEARMICLVGFKLVLMLALITSSLKVLLRNDIASLFSADPGVQIIAANLFFFAATLGLVDCLQMACSGALRGYKDARIPLVIQVIAFWVIAFPIAYSIALTDFWGPPLGIYGFWIGTVIAASIAATCLIYRWNLVSKNEIRKLSQSEEDNPV